MYRSESPHGLRLWYRKRECPIIKQKGPEGELSSWLEVLARAQRLEYTSSPWCPLIGYNQKRAYLPRLAWILYMPFGRFQQRTFFSDIGRHCMAMDVGHSDMAEYGPRP